MLSFRFSMIQSGYESFILEDLACCCSSTSPNLRLSGRNEARPHVPNLVEPDCEVRHHRRGMDNRGAWRTT